MADLIDRKVVMESITAEYNRKGTGDGLRLAWIEKAVNSVPSVSPQPKVGRWKFTVYDANRIGHYECSECHWNVLMNVSAYCPNCGVKMGVEE